MEDYFNSDSPSHKRRMQRKIIHSIDALGPNKHHFDNNFGLDFSLLQNPLYNPFPSKKKIPEINKSLGENKSADNLPIIPINQGHSERRIDDEKEFRINLRHPSQVFI